MKSYTRLQKIKLAYQAAIRLGCVAAIGASVVGLLLKFYVDGSWWAPLMALVASGMTCLYSFMIVDSIKEER